MSQKAAETYSGHAYSDYNQMLAKEDLDAVYISIPPFAHGAPERAVIHAGLAMFVEKPVHMDTKDAREISQMVNKAGIITAAGYQERYLDILDKAKELLKNRRIGFFMGYWMGGMPGRWRREKEKSGGQIHEQTTHEIDLARYLFGEVKTVYAVDRCDMIPNTDYNIEEASAVSMQFKSGIFGIMFSACFIQAGVRRSGLDIFCEDGSIEYRLRKSLTLSIAEGQETWGAKNQYTIDMDRTFIEAVRSGDGSRIRSPYPTAVKSAELSIAANESLITRESD